MKFSEDNLLVFFFGSPAIGFSSYPAEYIDIVGAYDKSIAEFRLECDYLININKSVIRYTEYGLSGVGSGQKGTRGGRNFGIFIQINGLQLNQEGQRKIIHYIDDFIKRGLMEQVKIFRQNNTAPKYYEISSFDDIGKSLDQLIELFKKQFITDFAKYVEPIPFKGSKEINLIQIENQKDNNSDNHHIKETPQYQEKDYNKIPYQGKDKEDKKSTNNESSISKKDARKPLVISQQPLLILAVPIFFLFVLHITHITSHNEETVQLHERIKQLEAQLDNRNDSYTDDIVIPIEEESDDEDKLVIQHPGRYKVKGGDTLGKIVRDYNQRYGTEFTIKRIAKINKLRDVSEKGAKEPNFHIVPNQVLKFE